MCKDHDEIYTKLSTLLVTLTLNSPVEGFLVFLFFGLKLKKNTLTDYPCKATIHNWYERGGGGGVVGWLVYGLVP